MRKIIVTILLLLPAAAFAQNGRVVIDIPPALAAKAAESVDVTLDGSMLRLASRFLSDDDDDLKGMVHKLEGIYVHSYEFENEGEYDRSIVDRIQKQLGPEWKRIVSVKGKLKENTEIYTLPKGDQLAGLVIIAAEPRELTIVNLVGTIDLDKLASLEGNFGIPKVSKHE
jgi:uncharacterized protein DUF4252